MCGYIFVSSRDQVYRPIDSKYLNHRGPDFTEEIDLTWCRFRHWRLSIQDLTSSSNQPYSRGTDYLIYNGEIYDYHKLGLKYFSEKFDSDTQLLFHSLRNGTFDLIKQESGFYSFVFVDESQKQIFAARDYFGKKPLYYYFDNDLLIVASEDSVVRDIAREYGKSVGLNAASIANYFRYKDLYYGSTFYEGVLELPPGSTVDFNFEKWQFSPSRSWEEYYASKPFYKAEIDNQNLSENSLDKLKQNLINSIEKRFTSDVPVQLALSGGVDSTLVAIIADDKKIEFERALTVSSSSRPSELTKSELLCEKFMLSQKVIDFDCIDVLDVLGKCISAQGGPLSHPHALAVFELTREAANNGKVLVTGEGADELMYGYDHYKNNDSTVAFLEHLVPSDYFDIRSSENISSLPDFSLNKFLENNDHRDLDVKTHLLSLLRRNDRISMQNSVEVRSAFLDFQLFQYIYLQQKKGTLSKGKDPLVKIIQDSYPDYKVDEKKIGFYIPFDEWFENHFKEDLLVAKYIANAKKFFEFNFGLALKNNVNVEGKLAWALLNIGLFLELEGELE